MRRGLWQKDRCPHRIELIKNLHQIFLQLESDLFTLEKKKQQSSFREDDTEGKESGQTHIVKDICDS